VLANTDVNKVLADLVNNKDVVRIYYDRYIDLQADASSSSPDGQGIIDKNTLTNYVTPPGTLTWTIITR